MSHHAYPFYEIDKFRGKDNYYFDANEKKVFSFRFSVFMRNFDEMAAITTGARTKICNNSITQLANIFLSYFIQNESRW